MIIYLKAHNSLFGSARAAKSLQVGATIDPSTHNFYIVHTI